MSSVSFQQRVEFGGSYSDLCSSIATSYGLGTYISHRIIEMGYEDLNIVLTTDKGKYFLKLFAKWRSDEDCKRYADMIKVAIDHGVRHPKLYFSDQGHLHIVDINGDIVRLVVTEFVEGKTFYELPALPNETEQQQIVQQVALIHQIPHHPTHVYDDWATTHFIEEYRRTTSSLDEEDNALIANLATKFEKIDIEGLPHCFSHGDIIKPNVLRSTDGEVFILDFSVANWYPRILDLGLILCNILFDDSSKQNFLQMYNKVLAVYQEQFPLTEPEIDALPLFLQAAHAMHIIGSTRTRIKDGVETAENDYWLNEGKKGLRFTLNVWS